MATPVIPSEGWGVLHLFLHVVRDGDVDVASARHSLLRAHDALVADGQPAAVRAGSNGTTFVKATDADRVEQLS